jgi:hypothetical protein
MEKMGQFVMVDYGTPYGIYQQQYCMGNYYTYYGEMAYQQPYLSPYIPYPESTPESPSQLKRSLKCLNLVETRKKDIDRYH